MKDLPEHELLSAYLDGELTAAEQARVEQFLAENPAARQTLDNLRSVSLAVQGLPVLRVGEDLSDRVLRHAERAILAGPNEPAALEPTSPAAAWRWQELFRRMVTSRGLAWSGAALAIALLLMLSSTPQQQRDVALAPEPIVRKPASPPMVQPRGAPEMWAADADRNGLLLQDAEDEAVAARKDARPQELPAPATSPAPERAVALPPPPKAEMDALRTAPAMPLEVAEEPPEAKRQFTEAEQPDVERLEDRAATVAIGESRRHEAEAFSDLPLLLVHCDITPEAARRGTFDQILAAQQIALRDGEPSPRTKQATPQEADPAAGEPVGRARRQLAEPDVQDGRSTGTFDVVFVEATPGQVEATLDQLAQLPEQFLAVSVKPAPGVESQQNLTRFSRAAPVQEEPRRRLRAPTPTQAEEAEPEEIAGEHADRLEDRPRSPAAVEPAPMPDQVGRPSMAERGPQMLHNGRGGYRGAAGMRLGAAPADAPPADAVAPGKPKSEAKGLTLRETEAEFVEPYRVLFVLRVVPPRLAAESATMPIAPPADIDAPVAEPAPTEKPDDDNG